MHFILNPLKGAGLPSSDGLASGEICIDPAAAIELFGQCPAAHVTPLHELPALAAQMGVGTLHLKDERARLGLGSFKALGAVHAIAKIAAGQAGNGPGGIGENALAGQVFVCASAGNHGLSVAAGARLFGADTVVYLSENVPETFSRRLRAKEARVVRQGRTYEESMAAAVQAATANGWSLLSDTTWRGYSAPARDVMEGYLIMGAEVALQMDPPPSHIFLQAGVGGLAAACTAAARHHWGERPRIIVVEPEFAPALIDSILVGKPVVTTGPVSNMGRLDCKEPSHLALKYLAREADAFMTVSDDQASEAAAVLGQYGLATSPSGAAGLAGLHRAGDARAALGIDALSRVLVYISEGPEDG